ncbi:hypothetical protein FQN57_007473 [Myotisia sp. PD_48]|nr:hypothetical protein FQN57_007473 [Myotisia sp. PD_48]
MASDDDKHLQSTHKQQAFGAGLKRKHVSFVSSSTDRTLTTGFSVTSPATSSSPAPPSSVSDTYLSIVLPSSSHSEIPGTTSPTTKRDPLSHPLCEICHLPITSVSGNGDASDSGNGTREAEMQKDVDINSSAMPHESSLAHQVCLPHSHPPSAVDRTGAGYKYLSAYGWDPDSRTGLGPTGSGIHVPLKAKIKNNTVGLGADSLGDIDEEKESEKRRQRRLKRLQERMLLKKAKNSPKLNAKQARLHQDNDRKIGEKLRDSFYRSEALEKYLGT